MTEPQTDCETCKYDVSEDDNDLYDMCEPMVEGECRYEPHKRKGEPMIEPIIKALTPIVEDEL